MQFKKIFTIIFVICIFIAFASFEIIRKSDNAILNIVTPNTIEVDLNGNLYIKGRAKNTIILSNGENVNPEELETELCKSPWISEAFVYAKNDRIFASVVNRKLLLELEEDEKQKIRISIENARKEINRELPPHQKISEMKIREKEFEKTSTGKLKRCRENEE